MADSQPFITFFHHGETEHRLTRFKGQLRTVSSLKRSDLDLLNIITSAAQECDAKLVVVALVITSKSGLA